MSAHESTASDAGSRGVGGGVMVGLLLFAAAATWLVGGSMAERSLYPVLLTVAAGGLAVATPYRLVRLALESISQRLHSEE